jgi:hypothetical protein
VISGVFASGPISDDAGGKTVDGRFFRPLLHRLSYRPHETTRPGDL